MGTKIPTFNTIGGSIDSVDSLIVHRRGIYSFSLRYIHIIQAIVV